MEVLTDSRGQRYDLVYSPDDDGWYIQRHSDDATSDIYATETEARKAFQADEVEFAA